MNKILAVIIALCLCSIINSGYSQESKEIQVLQKGTDIKITKSVEGAISAPIMIKYKITTPKVDEFDFVLALDSSGSFGVGGDLYSTQKKAVLEAIPRFIKEMRNNSEYTANDFKISIIGWNDKIDFAYGDLNNRIPANANLVAVENITSDIDILMDQYECDEEAFTNISIPIKASLDILDEKNNPINPSKRTSRFIILVTGRSEFAKAQQKFINEVRKKNYPIYIIGLDIAKESKLSDHLTNLGQNNPNRINFIRFIPADSNALAGKLFDALNEHLLNATKEPIARNVTIDETVYPYIVPDMNSIQIRGNSLGENSSVIKNTDGTNTIHLELADGLMPKTETEITLRADLKMNLPITVSENTKPTQMQKYLTHPSEVKIKWLNEMAPRTTDLPSNSINFGMSSQGVESRYQSGASSAGSISQTGILFSLLKSLGNSISFIGAITAW